MFSVKIVFHQNGFIFKIIILYFVRGLSSVPRYWPWLLTYVKVKTAQGTNTLVIFLFLQVLWVEKNKRQKAALLYFIYFPQTFYTGKKEVYTPEDQKPGIKTEPRLSPIKAENRLNIIAPVKSESESGVKSEPCQFPMKLERETNIKDEYCHDRVKKEPFDDVPASQEECSTNHNG